MSGECRIGVAKVDAVKVKSNVQVFFKVFWSSRSVHTRLRQPLSLTAAGY